MRATTHQLAMAVLRTLESFLALPRVLRSAASCSLGDALLEVFYKLCVCMYVVYMIQFDEVSTVVKALPPAISLVG